MVIIKVALLPHLLRPRQRRSKEEKIQGLQAYSVERLSKSLNKLLFVCGVVGGKNELQSFLSLNS